MTSLSRFWRALERPYGLCGVTAELRRLIGPELPAVAPLLRQLPVGSETYPCPTPGGDGCPRRVVMRGDGQFVALCGCSPKECDPLVLKPAEVVVQEFDPKRLCRAVADQLPLSGSVTAVAADDAVWSLGSTRSSSGEKQVFLLPAGGAGVVANGINQLLASFQSPWLALAPTHRSVTPIQKELAARAASTVVALEDIVFADTGSVLKVDAAMVVPHSAAGAASDENIFRREQNVWLVRFAGKTVHLQHTVGFDYIVELLRRPRIEIEALLLTGRTEPERPTVNSAGLDMADDKALRQVRAELERRKTELSALPAKDWPKKGSLQEEIAKLEAYLSQTEGRHGQARKVSGSAQRARTAVTNAIVRSIARIEKDHRALATHLRESIRTGTTLIYLPSTPVDWHF